ncbi:MAG: GTP-binding protein [Rhodospirillales bacterium]|nr:GTP-binding protein [Rhodospirillales bacterium]
MSEIAHVPTTLFTGFFGVGKTTAIRSLLARKPADEKWAILVNEFGEVAVDQAALEPKGEAKTDSGVVIRDIPGGCMCCMMNVPMRVAVTEILRRARPDRLLIEPTGMGHPAGILDQLRKGELADAVDVGAVICFVDPRVIHDPRIQAAEVFRDQIHIADILIASKADLAKPEQLVAFRDWAEKLYPPKNYFAVVANGEIDMAYLDIKGDDTRAPLFADLHHHEHAGGGKVVNETPTTGTLVRRENTGGGYKACGWIFPPDRSFDRDGVLDLLGPPGPVGIKPVERLKGVIRVGKEWLLIDRVSNEILVTPIAYRRDSRLEVIVPETATADWDKLEKALVNLQQSE